ncbi:hypothetical protein, partial [Pseudomonas sp. Sample_9]|uniref:hypothetical protein n=1 Tax=Pseudomonas sp. Sample_9 TaxID=2382158 RepID=UPI0019D60B0F
GGSRDYNHLTGKRHAHGYVLERKNWGMLASQHSQAQRTRVSTMQSLFTGACAAVIKPAP